MTRGPIVPDVKGAYLRLRSALTEIESLRAQLAARDEIIAQQEAVAAEYASARRELWRQAVDTQRLVVERDSTIAALREALRPFAVLGGSYRAGGGYFANTPELTDVNRAARIYAATAPEGKP